MTEELKKYEDSVKKKNSFGWTPQYEEEFQTDLNKIVFFPIVKQAMINLDWDIVFQDESSVEARRNADGFHWGQKITITYESGNVKVHSKSLGGGMWDFGRNSKRVKLFIYAFKEVEQKYDTEALSKLEEKVNKENNWDDYVIPNSLPTPKKQIKPKLWIPIIGGIISSILFGFLVAFFSYYLIYVIGLYEVVIGLLIGFSFKYLIQFSNYTNFDKLHYILIGVVLITYILNQYFLYDLIISENNIEPTGFLNFIQFRFQEGLTIESMNTGWIGLVISWMIQIGFTYSIAYLQLVSQLTQYQLEKVPMEVVDFAFYYFVKEKDEEEVRHELSKMGWVHKEDQDDVFYAIGALQDIHELNRIE